MSGLPEVVQFGQDVLCLDVSSGVTFDFQFPLEGFFEEVKGDEQH